MFQRCLSAFFVALVGVQSPAQSVPIPVLIVSGANNHDWAWTSPALQRMLDSTGRFKADITYVPAAMLGDEDVVRHYRAIVLDYNGPRWGEPAETNFISAVRGGTGVAVIHAANNSFPGWAEYEKLVGDLWREGTGHGAYHAFDLKMLDRTHPVTAGLGEIVAHPDELYHNLVHTPGTSRTVLATAFSSKESGGTGEDEPMILVGRYGEGRVFHTTLGHVWPGVEDTRSSMNDPQFQRLVARGVEWAATGAVAGDAGWITLFDGQSTGAWRGYRQSRFPEKSWTVTGGALVSTKGGSDDLVTLEEFGDFEFEFEWKATEKANSGVMYRVLEMDAPSWNSGPEYQVLDDGHSQGEREALLHAAAAIYDVQPTEVSPRAAGEWNQGRILVQGWKVEHFLNGKLAAACDFGSADGKARVAKSKFSGMPQFMASSRGHIALQNHGDEVAYRNIRVRPIGARTIALFNGKDFGGWKWVAGEPAALDQVWSVSPEGELVCKGQPAGYVRTEADYQNYVLELDWRWNPVAGGNRNSGVLLRMIEKDGVWPKSLEAQLEDGNAGDFWIIQEFPCKTAAERTNGRNCKKMQAAEKPPGEWNHYRITVDHRTVTLEINGKTVNQATEVLETPGKICLQSEGAEIHFRQVRLTPLP